MNAEPNQPIGLKDKIQNFVNKIKDVMNDPQGFRKLFDKKTSDTTNAPDMSDEHGINSVPSAAPIISDPMRVAENQGPAPQQVKMGGETYHAAKVTESSKEPSGKGPGV